MQLGTSRVDITPRVGVELAGFGPYLHRYSVGVRSPLMAKALAFEAGGQRALLINCELIGLGAEMCSEVAARIAEQVAGLDAGAILITCTHTHSGPASTPMTGWGEIDPIYLELLPDKLVKLGCAAFENLEEASMSYGEARCDNIGLNREREQDAPPLEVVLDPAWRSQAPEHTDTVVRVLKFTRADGSVAAFAANFGCHPVVCCQETRYLHGDFPAIAMVALEQEFPGAAGIFLQGAQGDINSCVVHKPEEEALRALDVIAARFAASIRAAMAAAKPAPVDRVAFCRKTLSLTPRAGFGPATLDGLEAEQLAVLRRPGMRDDDHAGRMAMVTWNAVRDIRAKLAADPGYRTRVPVAGIRLGGVELLGAPFEIMQMIKNEVVAGARAEHVLVLGFACGYFGYAPDREIAERKRGSYTTDVVPMFFGEPPFEDIHGELAAGLLEIDGELA